METDEKGVTLIELLLATALISVILGVVGVFYYYGTVVFDNESASSNNQQQLRLVVNDITKEIRNNSAGEITADSANNILTIGTIIYKLEDKKIKKNNAVIMENVGKFDVKKDGKVISLEIESRANRLGNKDSLKTTITIRNR